MFKQCRKCRRILSDKDFHKNANSSDGLHGICKECARKKAAASRERIKQKYDGLLDVYYDMLRRCYDRQSVSFRRYGGRGIAVCDEWRNDRMAFVRWAQEHGHRQGLQIDRIDNDGNYCPENCRFVTRAENQRNTSMTRLNDNAVNFIRANNISRKYTQQELARRFGVSQARISVIAAGKAWRKTPAKAPKTPPDAKNN